MSIVPIADGGGALLVKSPDYYSYGEIAWVPN
jgi:hypothetical protein